MGVLVPVVHPERVAGIDEAAALLAALGAEQVWISRLIARDADDLAAICAVIEPRCSATIYFDGVLDDAGLERLTPLVLAMTGTLFVDVGDMGIAVWPDMVRVNHRAVTVDDLAAVSRTIGVALARDAALAGDADLKLDRRPPSEIADGWVFVTTAHHDAALRLFGRLVEAGSATGTLSCSDRAVLDLARPFLGELGGRVEVSTSVPIAAAAAVAHRFAGRVRGFSGGGVIDIEIRFADGAIETHLVATALVDGAMVSDGEPAWRDEISAALARIRA